MTRFYLVESQRIIVNARGENLKIRPQSYQVFSFLLDHENIVVTKDQLFKNVWASLAVTDDSITQCIADIRRVLGPKHRSLLQTIPKKGFRLSTGGDTNNSPIIQKTEVLSSIVGMTDLAHHSDDIVDRSQGKAQVPSVTNNSSVDPTPEMIAAKVLTDQPEVEVVDSRADVQVSVGVNTGSSGDFSGVRGAEVQRAGAGAAVNPFSTKEIKQETQTEALIQPKRLWLAGAAMLAVCVGLLVIFRPYDAIDGGEPVVTSLDQAGDLPSIAVLPFQNLSGVVSDDYLSDGTTEDLMTDLSTLSGLLVIARSSVAAYKGKTIDSQTIARDLNVRYILSGSVRRSGKRIRINVELTDTDTRAQLWADRYDGDLDSIFDMQDEINLSIVRALALELTLSEKQRLTQRPTENLQAYSLYQLGRSYTFSNQHELGKEYLQKAVELDPNFSGAYAALAYIYSIAVSFGQSDDIENDLDRAFRLATKAVSMDNYSAEAHVALAQTFMLRGQHEEALRSVKRAIDSNPSYAPAHGYHGWVNGMSGNFPAALDAFSRAIRLQPTSNGVIMSVQGAIYYLAGRYDEAAAILEESNAINPNILTGHAFLAATYQRLGRYDESEWEAQEVVMLSPEFKINEWRWVQVFKNKDSPTYMQLLEDLQASGLLMD